MERLLLIAILFLLFYPTFSRSQSSFLYYRDQPHLTVSWESINLDRWFNHHYWKTENEKWQKNPFEKAIQIDLNYREIMGRVIECYGECLNFRDQGKNHVTFRSRLIEGDEVTTGEKSYIWIYLMEGTLIRLGPKSSLTFREIIIGEKKIFVEARLNYGLLAWRGRSPYFVEEKNVAESDTLFLPLQLYMANPTRYIPKIKEGDLEDLVREDTTYLDHSKNLNQLIKENTPHINQKKSETLLVFNNGSLSGEHIDVMVFVTPGQKSYWKQIDPSLTYSFTENPPPPSIQFFYRGTSTRETRNDYDWHEVNEIGKEITPYPEGDKIFAKEDFIISRPLSLLAAREWLIRYYSLPLFDPQLSAEFLLTQLGYRLWLTEKIKNFPYDIEKRLQFRYDYTTPAKDTNLP